MKPPPRGSRPVPQRVEKEMDIGTIIVYLGGLVFLGFMAKSEYEKYQRDQIFKQATKRSVHGNTPRFPTLHRLLENEEARAAFKSQIKEIGFNPRANIIQPGMARGLLPRPLRHVEMTIAELFVIDLNNELYIIATASGVDEVIDGPITVLEHKAIDLSRLLGMDLQT